MKEVNGTSYHDETPDDLIDLLEKVRVSRQRIQLFYGDRKTGQAWPPSYAAERGRIGRSMGPQKIPLLIKTSRSLGGEGILDHCIVEVQESVGGKTLWKHKGA